MALQKANPHAEPTIAACEPTKRLRDRIQTDLSIKGQLSCPQTIDMRAIVPVYAFQTPNKSFDIGTTQTAIPCAGADNILTPMFVLPPNTHTTRFKLKGFAFQLDMDVAGRAAAALAGLITTGRILWTDPAGLVLHALCEFGWDAVGGNPTLGISQRLSSHSVPLGTAADLYPRMMIEPRCPLTMEINEGTFLLWIYTNAINYPVATTYSIDCSGDYEI